MSFKDTDKILVNRDGVDYQADIGPLMGGGVVQWDDIEGKPDCFPTCDTGCAEVTQSLTDSFDDYSRPVRMPLDGTYFESIGYHPDFGWRALGGYKSNYDQWHVFRPNDSGDLTDRWYRIGPVSAGQYLKSSSHSVMVPIGDRLVAVMLDANGGMFRVSIPAKGKADAMKIGEITNQSKGLSLFEKTTYDAETRTWLLHLTTSNYILDDDGNLSNYGGETWTYTEDTGSLSLLNNDPKFNGLWVLDKVTVDGSTLYLTESGICDEAGTHTELWGKTMLTRPDNASIKYSPKLNQVLATVSKTRRSDSKDLFPDAKNLWVSNDKGKTWTVIDTEPDPTWTGEIVQWSGIDWIPDAINELGTKGLWVIQSMRGGAPPIQFGHLHTLTSGDGVNWNFEFGNKTELAFDGKYTSYDGKQFIVVGLGSDYDDESTAVDPEYYCRQAFISDTSTVTIPGIATVDSTEGLTAGQQVGGGEIIEIIDSTRFTFKGAVVVGDEVCPDVTARSIRAFKKVLQTEVGSAKNFEALKRAITRSLEQL